MQLVAANRVTADRKVGRFWDTV